MIGRRTAAADLEAAQTAKSSALSSFDCFLSFCRLVNILTGISALLCLVAHCMAIAIGPSFAEPSHTKQQVLRVYCVLLAANLVLVEFEWQFYLAYVKFLENWVARGLVHMFLAVITLELATSDGTSDFALSVRLYRTVAGTCMVACAGFYILGGFMCIGVLRDVRYKKQLERQRAEKDLQAIEKQREELQRLLKQ